MKININRHTFYKEPVTLFIKEHLPYPFWFSFIAETPEDRKELCKMYKKLKKYKTQMTMLFKSTLPSKPDFSEKLYDISDYWSQLSICASLKKDEQLIKTNLKK